MPITVFGGAASKLSALTDAAITSPADGQTIVYNGSKWANKVLWVSQLDYTLASDVSQTNNTAVTWTDLIANQNFTVSDANSLIDIAVRGNVLAQNGTGGMGSRLVIDSAGTPQNIMLGGAYGNGAGVYANVLAGTDIVRLTGLSAATHTVKVQTYMTNGTNNVICQAAASPNYYSLAIRVIEWL